MRGMAQSWIFFSVLIFLPLSQAWAQAAGGYSVDNSLDPSAYRSTVREKRSPMFTQDRVFSGTRFWLIDAGHYEVESWFSDEFNRNRRDQQGLWQLEIEMGIAPQFQLDLYLNFNIEAGNNGEATWQGLEGTQIELRYAFARKYNQMFANPVLYMEWHPRHNAPDRFELRLLLGGDMGIKWLWAANLYTETNIAQIGGLPLNASSLDMELGLSAAASYAPLGSILRVGVEMQVGADQHGNTVEPDHPSKFYPVLLLGPQLLLKWQEQMLKLTATCFFGLMPQDPWIYPFVIAGKQW